MATYPYTSGQSALVAAIEQLRRGFPATVDAGYLKRFNIGPGNESYVISILRFLGLIDEGGARVEAASGYFFGNDDGFRSGLEATIRNAYPLLFSDMGDAALQAKKGELTHWFRTADKTSEVVGQRQASTFQTLAALAGYGESQPVRNAGKRNSVQAAQPKKKTNAPAKQPVRASRDREDSTAGMSGDVRLGDRPSSEIGLTVRVEVNLPAGGDAETYDAIFKSIKKNLLA